MGSVSYSRLRARETREGGRTARDGVPAAREAALSGLFGRRSPGMRKGPRLRKDVGPFVTAVLTGFAVSDGGSAAGAASSGGGLRVCERARVFGKTWAPSLLRS
ncbi:hypothetical protein GCM10009654_44920 [Streptomyces hebeiensis]|uniref:Uncharacterized protein n=1 Tax=Streptomyces hebeiensis TaxID=229486 RepID=A0ABN1UYW0_9ACTN